MSHSFSARQDSFLSRMSKRADKAAKNANEQALALPLAEIAALFLQALASPAIQAIFAACKKQPPAPPPTPAVLVSQGVTDETFKQAHDAKFAAEQSVAKNKKGFHGGVVNQTAIEIMKLKGLKNKKAAKPLAISCLQTGLDESVEETALAMQAAKDNRSAILQAAGIAA